MHAHCRNGLGTQQSIDNNTIHTHTQANHINWNASVWILKATRTNRPIHDITFLHGIESNAWTKIKSMGSVEWIRRERTFDMLLSIKQRKRRRRQRFTHSFTHRTQSHIDTHTLDSNRISNEHIATISRYSILVAIHSTAEKWTESKQVEKYRHEKWI